MQRKQKVSIPPRENTTRHSFLGRSLTVSYRVKHTPHTQKSHSYLLKQNGNLCLLKTSLVHIQFFLWDAEPFVFLSLKVPSVTFFIIHPHTKLETVLLPYNEWMNGLWCIYTMEYYAAIQKEQTDDTSNNLYQWEIYFVKWKELNPKGSL